MYKIAYDFQFIIYSVYFLKPKRIAMNTKFHDIYKTTLAFLCKMIVTIFMISMREGSFQQSLTK